MQNILKRINSFDVYVMMVLKKHVHSKYMDMAMVAVTTLGTLGSLWIVMSLVLMSNRTYRIIGGTIITTLVISTIIGEGIIKNLVKRIRPCNSQSINKLAVARPISYSFPSGHTLSSFAAAGVLSSFFMQYRIVFIAIALLIGLSRVYLYVHYPTDVIAGIIIGIMCSRFVMTAFYNGYALKAASIFKSLSENALNIIN